MNKSKDIFEETDCLTFEQMHHYLDGDLNKEEIRKVELHLASCEFCTDALEGVADMENPESMSVILKQLKKNINRKLQHRPSARRKKRNPWFLPLIVIIIIVLLLIAFYLVDFTMKKEPHPSVPAQEQIDMPAENT